MATACANPPAGRARWTLELLADAMVKLTEYESLSHETVRRRLAENGLKPWRKDMWCIPKVDGEYVARMEDVLDLYAEAPIPRGRWSASTRARSSSSARCASRSRPSRANSNATITSIAATAPSISSSASTSTGRGARSKSPSGAQPKTTPNACANSPMSIIPTPSAGLCARRGSAHLAPLGVPLHPQACQLAQHGRDRDRRVRGQCLDRRIDNSKRPVSEIAAWERQRNAAAARIKWMSTTAKARAKMGRAYPDTFKES